MKHTCDMLFLLTALSHSNYERTREPALCFAPCFMCQSGEWSLFAGCHSNDLNAHTWIDLKILKRVKVPINIQLTKLTSSYYLMCAFCHYKHVQHGSAVRNKLEQMSELWCFSVFRTQFPLLHLRRAVGKLNVILLSR